MKFEHKTLGHVATLTTEQVQTIREVSIDYCFSFGLRTALQNTYASAKQHGWTLSECRGFFYKKLDKLLAGTVNVREGGSRNPFESMCMKVAAETWNGKPLPQRKAAILRNALAVLGREMKADKEGKAKDEMTVTAALVKAILKKDRESIEKIATRRLEEMKEMESDIPDIELDVEDEMEEEDETEEETE